MWTRPIYKSLFTHTTEVIMDKKCFMKYMKVLLSDDLIMHFIAPSLICTFYI